MDSPFHGRPARKRSLFAHLVEELGGRIVRGAYRPGDTLPNEAELCRELGASRTVVREAVKTLAAKGLVESRARTGIRVLSPIHWNLLDLDVLGWRYTAMPPTRFFRELFEIRHMIEPSAAALAAERASAEDIATIAAAFDDMAGADYRSDAAIDADLRFHRAILAASGNDLLLQMGSLIGVGLRVSFRITNEPFTVFLPLHRRVRDEISARRAGPARDAMAQLLSETRDFLERELAQVEPPLSARGG
jgi:GntR family transcriptional regulator, galactonate operon transcriptional repressor